MRGLIVVWWGYILSPHAILRILPPGARVHSSHAKATATATASDALSLWQWLTSKATAKVISRGDWSRKGGYVCMGGEVLGSRLFKHIHIRLKNPFQKMQILTKRLQ